MILTVTLNPCIDRTIFVDGLRSFDSNRVVRTEIDAGGKGINLSRIAHRCGADTLASGFLARIASTRIELILSDEGVPYNFHRTSGEVRVNVSVEDGSGKPPTTFNERGTPISAEDWEGFKRHFDELAPHSAWVCLGGSLPSGLDAEAYFDLFQTARASGCRLCVDLDGESMKRLLKLQPNLIKPNRDEAQRLLEKDLSSRADALDAAKALHDGGIEYAMISLGADGAVLACAEGTWTAESPKVEVLSTIGSGDSLLGGFLAGLERGDSAVDAFRQGIASGAATAMSNGAEIGSVNDIEQLKPLVRIHAE